MRPDAVCFHRHGEDDKCKRTDAAAEPESMRGSVFFVMFNEICRLGFSWSDRNEPIQCSLSFNQS